MARSGLCSRREAEAWIAEGRVALNGVALTDPAVNIKQDDELTR
jgi:23S rRNA pseudouridine2605 synthase